MANRFEAGVPSEGSPLEAHRDKVSSLVEQIHRKFDARAGMQIGFKGDIFEAVSSGIVMDGDKKRIDKERIDPSLRDYTRSLIANHRHRNYEVVGGYFRYSSDYWGPYNKHIDYNIAFDDRTSLPKIRLENLYGELGAEMDGRSIDSVRLDGKYFEEGSLVFARTVSFSFSDQDPKIKVAQRGMGWVSMLYDNPDTKGNVSLVDGQIVEVDAVSEVTKGKYDAKSKILVWSDGRVQSMDSNTEAFAINLKSDIPSIADTSVTYSFPEQINLYNELLEVKERLEMEE